MHAVFGEWTTTGFGRYIDYFRRIDGKWRVVYRRVVPMPLFLATTWASIGDRAVTVPIPLQPVDSSAWRPMSASPLRGVALISTSFRWNVKPWCRSRGQTTTGDGGFHLPGGHHRVPARSAPARIADARSRRLRARERDRSQYRRRNRPPHIHFADGPQQTGPRAMPASWTESARHSGARTKPLRQSPTCT